MLEGEGDGVEVWTVGSAVGWAVDAGVELFGAGGESLGGGDVLITREAGARSFGAVVLAKSGKSRGDVKVVPHPSKIRCRMYAILLSRCAEIKPHGCIYKFPLKQRLHKGNADHWAVRWGGR